MSDMLILPIDPSRPLLLLSAPSPQFKDRANGVVATDRDTGAPLMEASVTLPTENGTPQVLRVSIPTPGVPDGLAMGATVKATGLTFLTGEKNGRTWQIFRATAITPAK
ncbi:hypothetical protein KGA66_25460 [Actinocrinis puniceicyclus]|uniref:Regulatory protein n=2 Tax=Actinocrinis puniceicyclus TaxID=977794 RepID=A0A8J8BF92_9ACTN|nr:hypothetical protein [Actinocrinis puniceicyclus]MBS2966415.1 hypothetical protein [Actinocrinis puniceicyclus]